MTESDLKIKRPRELDTFSFSLSFSPKKMYLILGLIILMAFVIRVLFFNANPPALNQDEAMHGYNAYSIGKTLKDHRGCFLPAQMHGFGNLGVVSPMYTYLTVPFVTLFGLSETTVRLTSLLFNLALIPLLFVFVNRLFKNPIAGLVACVFFALNPWSIHFSRIGHEATLGPFFYFLLLYLYYDVLHAHKKSKSWIIAGIVLGISFYTYQVSWLMNPLLILLIGCIFYKETKKKYRQLLLSLVIGFVLFFPILYMHFLFPEPGMESRLSEISVFNSPAAIVKILGNYFYYFSPDFLLLKGDEFVFTFPGNARLYGEFHLYLIVLFIPGVLLLIYHSLRQKTLRREILLLSGLVILYPLPASLTNPGGWALRAYTVFPAFHIIAGLGLMCFLFRLKQVSEKKILQVTASLIIAGFVLFQSVLFLYNYYTRYPKQPSNYLSYQYGIKESIQFIQSRKDKYDKIFISGRINQPFIYVLFYTSYDPAKYHSIKKTIDPAHWGRVYEFDKFVFIDEEQMPLGLKGSLFMVSGSPPIEGMEPLHQVVSPDGSRILFTIWEF